MFRKLPFPIVLALLLLPTLALAAPKWVRIGLPASGGETARVIAWNTDAAGEASEIEYGYSASALTQKATGKAFAAKAGLGTVHEVTIEGLQPNKKVWYRVGGAGAWSQTYVFQTGPADACTPFKFIAGGDHRSDDSAGPNPKWQGILVDMTSKDPAFLLETGDLVRDGEDVKQWQAHMTMAEVRSASYAILPVLGNHDTDSADGDAAMYNQLWPLPRNSANNERDFYAFTYGNAVFVGLSTVTFKDDKFAMQAKFLDETLTKYASKRWKIVYYHHPSYTSYIDLKVIDLNHPANEQGQNPVLLPILDKHGVDLVLSGHNHFYERFAPLKGGKPSATGTTYVTTGGAGAFTYDEISLFGQKIEPMKVICGDGIFGWSGKAANSQNCSGKHHYLEVDVGADAMTVAVVSTAEQNWGSDPKNKGVIETFTIQKPGPRTDACAVPPNPDPEPDAGGSDAVQPDAGSTDGGVGEDAVPVDAAADGTEAPDQGASPDTAVAPDAVAPEDTTAAADADEPDVQAADGTGTTTPDTNGIGGQPDTGTGTATGSSTGASNSGCTAGSRGMPSGMWALLVLGLGWLAVRRRAVRA